jgi:hypothetical protein
MDRKGPEIVIDEDPVLNLVAKESARLDTADFVAAKQHKLDLQLASNKAVRIRALPIEELSETARTNTKKELLVVQYVERFRSQFETVYPHRRALYQNPKNEADVEVFSTHLPFKSDQMNSLAYRTEIRVYNDSTNSIAVQGFLQSSWMRSVCRTVSHLRRSG